MPQSPPPHSRLGRATRDLRRSLGAEVRRLRLDVGLTQRGLAAAAGIDQAHVCRIENGRADTTLGTLAALAAGMGGAAAVRIYPGTGPILRDHLQTRMLDALLRVVHPRWMCWLEVPVHRPARGVIDIVLDDQASPTILAGEAESDLRRLEAQTRWANEKAESLPPAHLWPFASADRARTISRLLILRSTVHTRAVARQAEHALRALYPARPADAYAALTTTSAPWPGPAILWVRLDPIPTVLATPPRGVTVGR